MAENILKLTIKQEEFCHKYVECGNASEAYRHAYNCGNMKPETVNRNAVELLNNNKIATRLKELQIELKEKSDIDKGRILNELGAILDAKITDYVDLTTEAVALPQSKREKKEGVPIQYMDVQRLVFKDFDQLTERQVKAIESIKQGRNGIELKLHGKSWSIERICKMLGYDAPEKKELTGRGGRDLIPSDIQDNTSAMTSTEIAILLGDGKR